MDSATTGLHPEQVDELAEYRSISVTAVVGLVLALFSPLALGRDLLIVIPAVAAIVCLTALFRIRRSEGRLLGKTPAVIGLGLACFFAAAVPARIIIWRKTIHARATPIALAWLETLQRREPHNAHQLTKPDLARRSLTDTLWAFYKSDDVARRELEAFVEEPLVQFLLALGQDTQIRFYQPAAIEPMSANSHRVSQSFAVTYEDPGEGRTTFFMVVALERREPTANSGEQWRVADYAGGVRPPRFEFY
jgi:hypothetical protein